MSAVATRTSGNRRPRAAAAERSRAPTLFERDRVTLEDIVLKVWEDLALAGAADCPVCGGSMAPAGCQRCGAELE